jgi:hypothetical protein
VRFVPANLTRGPLRTCLQPFACEQDARFAQFFVEFSHLGEELLAWESSRFHALLAFTMTMNLILLSPDVGCLNCSSNSWSFGGNGNRQRAKTIFVSLSVY